MAIVIILPKLDEATQTGKIVKWLKREGEWVEKGEAILEIETEKVNFEVEAEESGILSKIMAEAGDNVAVGTTIAFILQPGEKAPEVPEPPVRTKERVQVEVRKVTMEAKAIKASPLAKRIAKENNIDLSLVVGTGPGGRITKEDVMQALEESKVVTTPLVREETELAGEEIVPLSSM